jgi:UDP:flavonoid glycosyltransferase YjiC (YdhE family)
MTEVHLVARPRVLFVAEAVTLAHVARPVALARKLVARGYRPIIAADPRFAGLCPPEGWDTTEIRSIATADFLRALARGKPVYELATLERYVEEDLALLRDVRPAVVVGDFRISLSVSARVAGVPYINISNAYWSPHARPRWHAPTMPWSRYLPAAIDDALFRAARPLAFRLHARPMLELTRRHGLPPLGKELRHVYTDGDVTLYADSPALVATFDRPSTHRYLGLVDWSPAAPLPRWWNSLPDTPRPIYVTLGSSGDAAKLPRVLEGLARLGHPLVVATAGAPVMATLPAQVHLAEYLPGDIVARRSCLVVCNGGSPTGHQALLAGVPVLGIPDNLDQVLNMTYLQQAGVGDWLAPRDLTADRIERLARRMLAEPGIAQRATAVGVAERSKDIALPLEAAIGELCTAGTAVSATRPAR